jgi:hypothetical protein
LGLIGSAETISKALPERTTSEVHRIYRIQFLASPQTP